jgi:hypothetical protein
MSRAGLFSRRESVKRVFVTKGMVKKFARASATKALRTVEPSCCGSGLMFGFAAGDLVFDGMVMVVRYNLGQRRTVRKEVTKEVINLLNLV